MAPVHLYLATWVLGGVLLGAEMLLDARGPGAAAQAEHTAHDLDAAGSRPSGIGLAAPLGREKVSAILLRIARVTPLGLIGFGLSGLVAKGLEFELWPGTFLVALSIGLGLIALGYRLSRVRSSAPHTLS